MLIQGCSVAQPVPMVEPEVVKQIRGLAGRGWGAKRIASELGVARNTVRRYIRGGPAVEVQVRPAARVLDGSQRVRAVELFEGAAGGNAVVVQRLLAEEQVHVTVRTVQRAVAARRRELRASAVATVRYETAPGHQMQIDFGQKLVRIGGAIVRVYLLVAVLSYSRRIFAKAFLAERQDDWLEGIAAAFRHFGGVPRTLLGDRARALVARCDRETATVVFTPAYLQFCRDWDVEPRACAPYRARTKGKTESGVKYVKRNGLADLEFDCFAGLEGHLDHWMVLADDRIHGTTHERPRDRFERAERQALKALPARPLPVRERALRRRVSHDAFVEVDTVRYSVPHTLIREWVEVWIRDHEVRVLHGGVVHARHRRSFEPFAIVVDPTHHAALWRSVSHRRLDEVSEPLPLVPSPLEQLGRSLEQYAAVVAGGAR